MMREKKLSLAKYLRSTVVKWNAATMGAVLIVSVFTLGYISKIETEKKSQGFAIALATAYRPMILNGNIRFAEEQMKESLALDTTESVTILNPKGEMLLVYPPGLQPKTPPFPCSATNILCWHGIFKFLSVREPIYFNEEKTNLFGYLQLTMRPVFDGSLLVWLTLSFATICFIQIMGLTRKLIPAANDVSSRLRKWSEQIRAASTSSCAETSMPFTDLEPMSDAVNGLQDQIERLKNQIRTSAHVTLLKKMKHELKTPIGQLKRFHHVLFEQIRSGSTPAKEYLESCERALNRTQYLVDQLSTLEGQMSETQPKVCLVGQETKKLIQDLSSDEEIREKDLKINFENSSAAASAEISPNDYQTIVLNLIRNAIHASPKNGTINVRNGIKENAPIVSVSDDGPGIPSDLKEKIFEFGFSTKGPKGTGLGLGIVKELCERHGATIGHSNKTDRGTEFFVKLKNALPQEGSLNAVSHLNG